MNWDAFKNRIYDDHQLRMKMTSTMMMMMMMIMMKGWEPPHRLIHNISHGLLWNQKDALKSRLIDKLMSNGGEDIKRDVT